MHVDVESTQDVAQETKISPTFAKTMNAAVWRGANDDDASAMDQSDHLGLVWIMFSRGKDPRLTTRFREAVSSRLPLSINDYCFVAQTIPADLQLFAAAIGVLVPSLANRFIWRIDSSLYSSLDGLLEGFFGPSGHQYFDLDGTDTILLVSVGEYDDNWWHSNAEPAL
jgi:hypothetical protein